MLMDGRLLFPARPRFEPENLRGDVPALGGAVEEPGDAGIRQRFGAIQLFAEVLPQRLGGHPYDAADFLGRHAIGCHGPDLLSLVGCRRFGLCGHLSITIAGVAELQLDYWRALIILRVMSTHSKKPHPAEIAAEAVMIDAIRSADHFMASLFVGRGRYEKQRAKTVREALQARIELRAKHRVNQTGMIYAVLRDGRAIFITDSLISKLVTVAQQAR